MPWKYRAFTLLELILAMGIVAMITLALYAAMRTAYRARDSAAAQQMAARPAVIVLDFIQRDLESLALPTANGLAGAFTGVAMGTGFGQSDVIDFYTIGRDWQATSTPEAATLQSPLAEGTRHVEYALGSAAGESVLVRRVARNILATTPTDLEEEVIARGVQSFAVRYYDGLEWTEQWDSATLDNAVPLAVEVTIELDQPRIRDATQPYRMTRLIPIVPQNAISATGSTTP